MLCVELVPVHNFKEIGPPHKIEEGETIVGRSSAQFAIDDKRCSRKQAVLTCTTKNNSVTLQITPNGTNPCLVYQKSKESKKPIQLTKGKVFTLHNGDVICFLSTEHQYICKIISKKENEDVEMEEIEEEEQMEVSEEEEKKPRSKPKIPCKYGAKCYRTHNKEHTSKYSHPGDAPEPTKPTYKSNSSQTKENKKKEVEKVKEERETKKKDVSKTTSTSKKSSPPLKSEKSKENDSDDIEQAKSRFKESLASESKAGSAIIAEEDEVKIEKAREEMSKKITMQQKQAMQSTIAPRQIIKSSTTASTNLNSSVTSKHQNSSSTKEGKTFNVEYTGPKELQYSLAFPALSTNSMLQFDIKIAAKILAVELIKFLTEIEEKTLKLVLVDPDSDFAVNVQKYLTILFKKNKLPLKDVRFEIVTDEEQITLCRFVVCPVSWRYKPSHPISKLILDRLHAHPLLDQHKAKHPTAKCGEPFVLETPANEDFPHVQYLFLINSPNMNPLKPDYLEDYETASPLLESSYSKLFSLFRAISKLQ